MQDLSDKGGQAPIEQARNRMATGDAYQRAQQTHSVSHQDRLLHGVQKLDLSLDKMREVRRKCFVVAMSV